MTTQILINQQKQQQRQTVRKKKFKQHVITVKTNFRAYQNEKQTIQHINSKNYILKFFKKRLNV